MSRSHRMGKLIGYALILAGVLGVVATTVILTYLLFVILIWCPLKNCIPQFLVVVGLGILALTISVFSIQQGTRRIHRSSGTSL